MENQINPILRLRWYRGVIDPERIKEEAEDALSRDGWNESLIVIVEAPKQRVLFMKIEKDEGEEWILIGAFEYGSPPKEQNQPVRWIRLSHLLPETFLALHGFTPSSPPVNIKEKCDAVLREAGEWTGVIRGVTCFLTLDANKKIYRVDLIEGSDIIAQKVTTSTDDVINFLRYPLRKGEYFSTADGTHLKWDPLKDVEYDDIVIRDDKGKLESFSLSIFRPLIHRSSFFPDSYTLPSTCEDYLQTKTGNEIILRVLVDEQMKNMRDNKYLKIEFEGLEVGNMESLEEERMGIYDIALIAECDQLVDTKSGLKYHFSIDAESLAPLQLVHLLSEYPKLQSVIISHIEDLQLIEYEEGWEEEPEYIEPDIEYIEPE